MTELEIMDRMNQIRDRIFVIQMNDHWSKDDYAEYNALVTEYKILQEAYQNQEDDAEE